VALSCQRHCRGNVAVMFCDPFNALFLLPYSVVSFALFSTDRCHCRLYQFNWTSPFVSLYIHISTASIFILLCHRWLSTSQLHTVLYVHSKLSTFITILQFQIHFTSEHFLLDHEYAYFLRHLNSFFFLFMIPIFWCCTVLTLVQLVVHLYELSFYCLSDLCPSIWSLTFSH